MCEAPLHIAVAEEQEAAARVLIDNGAVVNVRNGLVRRRGRPSRWWGAGEGVPHTPPSHAPLQTLQTPLHLACENNDVKCASLLLERGADPELIDKVGRRVV